MNPYLELVFGVIIVAAAVWAIIKRVDVRLALLVAAFALGALGQDVPAIVRQFFLTLTNEQFVVPICCAMGFAYVMRLSGCDQHLVQLLVKPLRRFRLLLIPGAVVVGFLVNIPVVSQTSTVVAIGSVLVPLLRAARISPLTTGAALLLGCSIGGELLNPGAPEFRTISQALSTEASVIPSTECVAHVFPLVLPHLLLATGIFWVMSLRTEARYWLEAEAQAQPEKTEPDSSVEFRVNLVKAFVPLVPITLLFLTGPPLQVISVPKGWLVDVDNPEDLLHFDSRLIGAAMLVGVVLAALVGG